MDTNDFLQREWRELFSQILVQAPVAESLVFDAAEQCIPYQNAGWKFHDLHVDDATAYAAGKKALDWLTDTFPVITASVSDSGVIWGDVPAVHLSDGVHCPVLFRFTNKSDEMKNLACIGSSLPLWQAPRDPWNIHKESPVPSAAVPPGKDSWMVATVLSPEPGSRPGAHSGSGKWDIRFSIGETDMAISIDVSWVESFEIKVTTTLADDPAAGEAVPCNIKVITSAGTAEVPAEFRNYMHVTPHGMHPFFHCADYIASAGEIRMRVPAGITKIVCTKGFEYEAASWEGDIGSDSEISLPMKKIDGWDLFSQGWISSDTHIHWAKTWVYLGDDTAELSIIQKASDCHVISVLTLSQFDGYQEVFTPVHHPVGLIAERCSPEYIMAMDEEYRNSGPYGHVNLLGLKSLVTPVSTGFTKTDVAPDYPDNTYAFVKAHEQGAIAMCSHGIFSFDKVLIAKGLMDCVDQVSTQQYYQVLNCGFKVPTTVGTDSNARPMGKMRTYVKIDGDLSYPNWIDGIRKGRTFVTNGPLIRFTANGLQVGSTLAIGKNDTVRIEAQAFSNTPLTRIEVVYNGQVCLSRQNNDNSLEIGISGDLEIPGSGWIAFRGYAGETCSWMDHAPGVHSSPIYVEVDQKKMDPAREDVDAVISELESYLAQLPSRAKFDGPEQLAEVSEHVLEAIRIYKAL
ncbi:MAG: CehA/McbA family metallohydrolase [Saccharofermentanales bacterium]